MANKTKIEWCDFTWNPITGCTPISEGCKNCYASGIAKRFWGDRKFSDIQLHPNRIDNPKLPKKQSKIFVCSMSDLFHVDVESFWLLDIFQLIIGNPQHIFLILTKRPSYAKDFFESYIMHGYKLPDNVWLGATVENQKAADERIPILLSIPAAKRFVSVEPMLEKIDLNLCHYCQVLPDKCHEHNKIDWVICGAETGAKKRYCDIEWIRSLRNQCVSANVPFFFKKNSQGEDKIDGISWNQFP